MQLDIKNFRILLISAFVCLFIFLITAPAIWPQGVIAEMTRTERITNLLPFVSMVVCGSRNLFFRRNYKRHNI